MLLNSCCKSSLKDRSKNENDPTKCIAHKSIITNKAFVDVNDNMYPRWALSFGQLRKNFHTHDRRDRRHGGVLTGNNVSQLFESIMKSCRIWKRHKMILHNIYVSGASESNSSH